MRITGRQLRQIIKEEVTQMAQAGNLGSDEIMINEIEGTTDYAGTFNKEIQTGGPSIEAFKKSMKGLFMVKTWGKFGVLAKVPSGSKMHDKITFKVNMVIPVTEACQPMGLNDLTIDGVKPESGLPTTFYSSSLKAVAYCDCMVELVCDLDMHDYNWVAQHGLVPQTIVYKMVKFRNA